jgi:hypothetical protein
MELPKTVSVLADFTVLEATLRGFLAAFELSITAPCKK